MVGLAAALSAVVVAVSLAAMVAMAWLDRQ